MHDRLADTVAAIATARGKAALAIVRITGPDAIAVADSCFTGTLLGEVNSHTAHVGFIRDASGSELDQVVATVFRAPTSVTGEDVVEISCHGGDLASSMILARLLEAGARMAAPGEFTRRAFVNGKIDLSQAEAVADVIHASSTLAHRASLTHLQGRYSGVLQELRQQLVELAALVELELDFSDEDVEFADRDRLVSLVSDGTVLLRRLLESYRTGLFLRDGVRVVIAGRPNAGKSTLLNALVGFDRAIVNERPGTTRDALDADAEIAGIRFVFTDTAGLRDTADDIEAEGVSRARQSVSRADVLLYVFDLTAGFDAAEQDALDAIRHERPDLPIAVIGNKRDLAPMDVLDGAEPDAFPISARIALRDEAELDELVQFLISTAGGDLTAMDGSAIVLNERHHAHLDRAARALDRAQAAIVAQTSGDALALDLRCALDEIGAITGAVTSEEVLDQIFSRFCIGK